MVDQFVDCLLSGARPSFDGLAALSPRALDMELTTGRGPHRALCHQPDMRSKAPQSAVFAAGASFQTPFTLRNAPRITYSLPPCTSPTISASALPAVASRLTFSSRLKRKSWRSDPSSSDDVTPACSNCSLGQRA